MFLDRRWAAQALRLVLLFCSLHHATSVHAETAQVKYVIDGDTLVLSDNRRVRLLAINSPEVEGERPAEAGGEAAKRWLKARLEGQQVSLVADQQQYDKYGRSLYYLFDVQGRLINEQLLAKGLAVLSVYPPNLKYLERLQQAQAGAESRRVGVWALPRYQLATLGQVVSEKRQGWQRILVVPGGAKESRKYMRLLLASNADIRIAKANGRYFPALQNYVGCELEVRGWLSWHKGRASILIRHPSAVLIKDSNTCHEAL